MQLFLEAMPIILRLFPRVRGHLLFSNYSRNNLPKPPPQPPLIYTLACRYQYLYTLENSHQFPLSDNFPLHKFGYFKSVKL